jgi:hypothetical protein
MHLGTQVYDPAKHAGGVAWKLRRDVYLTQWIFAWEVHAITTAPEHLFDANIFHPAPCSLALAEHMLGAMPLYLPVALVSRDPVFAHQATLLLTFACAFLAALALVRDWTGSWPAAVIAGVLFAFNPFRFALLATFQMEGSCWLPLIPLYARRSVGPGARSPVLLGIVAALAALNSYYFAYLTFIGAPVFVVVVLAADPAARRCWKRLVVPLVAAALVVALVTLPYVHNDQLGSLTPPPREVLLRTSGSPFRTGAPAALAIALVTLPFWHRGMRGASGAGWIWGLGAFAVVAHLLSLGPEIDIAGRRLVTPYAVLARVVPGFVMTRVPLRFDVGTTMGLAALSGIGFAGAFRDTRRRWLPVAVSAILTLASVLVVPPRPFPLRPIEVGAGIPGVYRWLSEAAPGPVLEVPLQDFDLFPRRREVEARRTYLSIYHWRPLLNGFSGYRPPSFGSVSALARAAPDADALRLLARTTGVRYVVVHRAELTAEERRRWRRRPPWLRVRRVLGPDIVLEFARPFDADLMPALLATGPRATTLLSTSLAPLPPVARRAELKLDAAPPVTARAGVAFEVYVEVRNPSSVTWPALAPGAPHLVRVAFRWEDEQGRSWMDDPMANALPYDLAPGASVRVSVAVVSPQSGPGRLTIGVAQDSEWFAGVLGPFDIRVEPAADDAPDDTLTSPTS